MLSATTLLVLDTSFVSG